MKYETTFEGKPLQRVDSSITSGKKTQAGVEAKDYEFGKMPNSAYVTCIYKDAVYVVLKTDKVVQCTCQYFRENPGQICEHILGLQITKEGDFEATPQDIITLLEETEGWKVNAKGMFVPPSKPFTPEVVATLPPIDEKPAEPAKKTPPVKKPPVKKTPTPTVAADVKKTYTCKICGTEYPTTDAALHCIESHQAMQEVEETKALVDTTGKTSDQMWSDAQIEVMKKTVAIGATPAEFAYFLNVAKYSGLNPFLREIYFIKTEKGQVSIITARDGYLTIAKRDPRFRGIQSMEVCKNDEFNMHTTMGEGGEVTQTVGHTITDWADRGEIIGAWARGKMAGEDPVIIFTSMKEYDKGKQPLGGKMWKQYPSSMIRKVAEAMVLKRIAGISGLVTDAEVGTDVQIVDAEVI